MRTGFWWGNLRKRDHLEGPGVDGRIILRWIFRKWDVWVWTGSSWLRIGTGVITEKTTTFIPAITLSLSVLFF